MYVKKGQHSLALPVLCHIYTIDDSFLGGFDLFKVQSPYSRSVLQKKPQKKQTFVS